MRKKKGRAVDWKKRYKKGEAGMKEDEKESNNNRRKKGLSKTGRKWKK
jgi:hypothetical protein